MRMDKLYEALEAYVRPDLLEQGYLSEIRDEIYQIVLEEEALLQLSKRIFNEN